MKDKHIIVAITGGIAAYKAAILVRLLIKQGAHVQVIMTPLAKEFITPLTLATLSKRPILVDFFDPENGNWNSHIDLGLWADAMIIAPATANTMAKMANGIADNLLLTTYLSARCPVFVAPAMDLDMLQHPATRQNMETLKAYGNHFIEPAQGELASGLHGKGRMEEPEKIVEKVTAFFLRSAQLKGKKFMVTAGPTYEKFDAVRFIGNYSSGKMGYALADELAARGAKVTLISGSTAIEPRCGNIERINVLTAQEMLEYSAKLFPQMHGAILSAAVADFKPISTIEKKVKKEAAQNLTIELVPTQDIAAELGKAKTQKQILIGFALETENEIENALYKVKKKNFDFIVLNSLRDKGAGFNHDTNKVTIIDQENNQTPYPLKPKPDVAKDIVDYIVNLQKLS